MKKILATVIAAASVFACGIMPASAAEIAVEDYSIVQPFASYQITSVSYGFSSSSFSADVDLSGKFTGSATLELQKKSGTSWVKQDSVTKSFSNASNVYLSKSRSSSSGTYRLVLTITIGGESTSRTSSEYTIWLTN